MTEEQRLAQAAEKLAEAVMSGVTEQTVDDMTAFIPGPMIVNDGPVRIDSTVGVSGVGTKASIKQ